YPQGDRGHRARPVAGGAEPAASRPAHRGHPRRRVDSALRPRTRRLPTRRRRERQVLAAGAARRQRQRRPQPRLLLPADVGLRKLRGTPMTVESPLQAVHQQLGASFTDFAGWNMPVRYSSELAEHRAVREAAGIFDLSHMAEIEITGAEVGQMLDHAFVGNFSNLKVGRARYSMLCDEDGGILDDLVTYRLDDEQYLVVANAANAEVALAALRERAGSFDADVSDRNHDYALIAVQGPNAAAIVGPLADTDLTGLKYYGIVPAVVAGQEVLLARTGYTGEDGFELYCTPAQAEPLWQSLTDAGEPYGLTPAGLACRDTLRLEAGMPLYGNELSRETTPFEANMGRMVKFEKTTEFVGQ